MRPFCCALAVVLVCAGLVLAGGGAANAQTSTTQVSNSGQAAGDSQSLADHDLTQSFRTGDNSSGYTLTGVSFYLTDVADASAQYDVSVYSFSPGSRDQMIGTLTPPDSLVADSLNTWTTDGAYLPPGWLYYVVIDSHSSADNQVSRTDSAAEDDGASEGWSIGNFSHVRSRDDSANNWALRFINLQIQVHGYARTSDTAAVPSAAPAAPTVTGTSYTTLYVSWTPPANTGPQITSYEVQYREGSSGDFVYWGGTGTILSTTITGLTSDTSYEVQVRASNAGGASDWSASGTASTHLTEAGAPSFGSANVENQEYTQNVQVGLDLPIAEGGDPPLTYTITGPNGEGLPAGLRFNAGPRVLYGWPTAAQEAKTYTYTATDYDKDSASLTFTITIQAADSVGGL